MVNITNFVLDLKIFDYYYYLKIKDWTEIILITHAWILILKLFIKAVKLLKAFIVYVLSNLSIIQKRKKLPNIMYVLIVAISTYIKIFSNF